MRLVYLQYLLITYLLIFPWISVANEYKALSDLDELQWKNRIVIVFSNTQNAMHDDMYKLKAKLKAIDERDILWFVIQNKTIKSNYPGELNPKLYKPISKNFSELGHKVILIGKDGRFKLGLDAIDLKRIFSTIDAMPMRQQEMRERK